MTQALTLSIDLRAAMAEVVAKAIDGATVHLVTDMGATLSEHDVTGTIVVGTSAWATLSSAVATGSGRADHIEVRSGDARIITGGQVDLGEPEVDEGADVILEPLVVRL